MEPARGASSVRLAEVIGALSVATDLGMGQPLEHALRRCLLAVRLGDAIGLTDRELRDVYYVALVCSVGCTIKLQSFTPWFTDEIAAAAQAATLDPTDLFDAGMFLLLHVGEGYPPLSRARKLISAAAFGQREMRRSSVSCHEICRSFGEMLGFEASIQGALGQMHERWDGRGEPARLKGEEQALPARIAHLAGDVEIFRRLGGVDAAIAVVRQRAGKAYDPQIAERFCQEAPRLLSDLGAGPAWDLVMAAEPSPAQWLDETQFDGVARALAHFADAKSPFTISHSTGVAELAEAAARKLGLAEADLTSVRRAGLLHDIGSIGVPVGIWDKPGQFTQSEWERVRMHPYLTERVLAYSSTLVPLGSLAALHHERLDGSGYHRGVGASGVPVGARILAAADAFHARIEPRPHRPALSVDAAADDLRLEAQAGRLDREAVNGVLGTVGRRPLTQRGALPAGLSDREVEVLRLVARGLSNRAMAETLYVSPKTIGHHIQHIYDKIGVSSRPAATLFAMRYDLVRDPAP